MYVSLLPTPKNPQTDFPPQPTAGISTISIVLLTGPSTNVVPLSCIVDSAPNTGTYIWTPPSSLTPTGNSGYGLQIIDDASGKFQYSTQFGISNPNPDVSSSSSVSSSGGGATATQLSDGQVQVPTGTLTTNAHHSTKSESGSAITTSSSHKSHYPSLTSILVLPSISGFPSPSRNSTSHHSKHHSSSSKHHPYSQHVGTGIGTGSVKNATQYVTPTKHITKPSSLGPVTSVVVAQTTSSPVEVATSAATSPAATTTGKSGAVGVRVGVVKAGLVMGLGGLVVGLLM